MKKYLLETSTEECKGKPMEAYLFSNKCVINEETNEPYFLVIASAGPNSVGRYISIGPTCVFNQEDLEFESDEEAFLYFKLKFPETFILSEKGKD